jgi:CheY-like chemotaxis protein
MGDSSKKTVLVVDDEPDVRLFLQTILENGGFDVMLASHGKQALERMTEKKPDAISLDLVMPMMSGLKFYRYIQKNKDRREIPVVVVTAHGKDEFGSKGLQELREEAARRENLYFLEKPVKPAAYLSVLRQAMGLADSGREVEDQDDLRGQVESSLRSADEDKLKEVLRVLSGK